MIKGMASQYKGGKVKCRDFTDGSTVCATEKAWSIFYATLNKHKWSDTSARSVAVSETVFQQAIEETLKEIVDWYAESVSYCKDCDE